MSAASSRRLLSLASHLSRVSSAASGSSASTPIAADRALALGARHLFPISDVSTCASSGPPSQSQPSTFVPVESVHTLPTTAPAISRPSSITSAVPISFSPFAGSAKSNLSQQQKQKLRLFSASAFRMASPVEVASNKMFGGVNKRYEHDSSTLGCKMKFSIYFPPAATTSRVPVIYWLSGLTCNDENFIQKSFAQKYASELGVALIAPDTSPRGLRVEGEADSWDFGVGAGFYLNATADKWRAWQMYDYVTEELHRVLAAHYSNLDMQRCGVMGHSMGGHGALTIFFKNPTKYKSVSAFAPICNPMECPWGQKAFKGYLGDDKEAWENYDATFLVKQYPGPKVDILIDQGDQDKFYHEKQLLPENFQKACTEAGVPLTLRFQGGYDHSYFFIASFIEDHIKHHAKALKA